MWFDAKFKSKAIVVRKISPNSKVKNIEQRELITFTSFHLVLGVNIDINLSFSSIHKVTLQVAIHICRVEWWRVQIEI